jgi:inorganic pyrophosphatase
MQAPRILSLTLPLFVWLACGDASRPSVDYAGLPLRDANGSIQAVIEIPAGTNQKREYRREDNAFPIDRTVKYLPYPANYGFLPGTYMDPEEGGDGDALDVLVIGEAQPTGTVLAVVPIGILQLLDRGEIDDKVIAVPTDAALQVVDADDLHDLDASVLDLIRTWFTHYKGPGVVQFVGWQGAAGAAAEIDRWQVEPPK